MYYRTQYKERNDEMNTYACTCKFISTRRFSFSVWNNIYLWNVCILKSSRHCKAYRLVQYNAHSINAQNQDSMEILKDIVYIVYLLVKYLFSQLIFKCLFKMFTCSYIKTLFGWNWIYTTCRQIFPDSYTIQIFISRYQTIVYMSWLIHDDWLSKCPCNCYRMILLQVP